MLSAHAPGHPRQLIAGQAPLKGPTALAAALALLFAPATAVAKSPLRPEASPASASASAAPAPAPPAPGVTERLSDERTLSRWAYVLERTTAYSEPSIGARALKRLRTLTPDRTPELVLALRHRTTDDGQVWVQVRLPMRPNNTTGWVKRSALGRLRAVTTALRINRRRLRATLYNRGRRAWSSHIGVGRPRWPTPAGRFYVRERLVPLERNGIYGVFAFGLSAYSSVLTDWPGGGMIGVHGTNQPEILPGRVSHGCVRVPNRRIARLRKLMPLGTPVEIV